MIMVLFELINGLNQKSANPRKLMMNDGNTKTVKVHGYKARVEKNRPMKKVH
jgi:hypothetical protein